MWAFAEVGWLNQSRSSLSSGAYNTPTQSPSLSTSLHTSPGDSSFSSSFNTTSPFYSPDGAR